MSEWDGHERRDHSEFSQYKELILTEIKNLKTDFRDFKVDIYAKLENIRSEFQGKISNIQVVLATINTKLMFGSGILALVISIAVPLVQGLIGSK